MNTTCLTRLRFRSDDQVRLDREAHGYPLSLAVWTGQQQRDVPVRWCSIRVPAPGTC